MAEMRRFALVVLAACVVAAAAVVFVVRPVKSVVKEQLAVGWRGDFTYLFDPTRCDPSRDGSHLLVADGKDWRAEREGTTVVPCSDGEIVVTVRAPATLAITALRHVGREPMLVELVAEDAAHQRLSLGDGDVTWDVAGPIATRDSPCVHHTDMDFPCAIGALLKPRWHTYVVATAPGSATIIARFGGLEVRQAITAV